jgi:hypothetical protein
MIITDKPGAISGEIYYEGEFTALLYENGIVELVWDRKIKLITDHTLKNVRDSLFRFGGGRRMPVYVSTFDFMETTHEGKLYAGTYEAQEFTLANAVQIDNLAKKIMFNLFLKFYGYAIPAKAFRDKTSAFEWLLSVKP